MCGIIGYVGNQAAAPILLEGLQRLEYRGYDSAGIAVVEQGGELTINKSVGRLQALMGMVANHTLAGGIGIGHTRWATHGRPSNANAHPHLDCQGNIVVIHNGIVENYLELKHHLLAKGHIFTSETDTEVIVHLLEDDLPAGAGLTDAVAAVMGRIRGAQAIVAVSRLEPDRLVAARVGNAGGVVIGYGKGEMFLASDLPALLPHTRELVFLRDGDIATISAAGATYRRQDGSPLDYKPETVPYDLIAATKGNYRHFMLKEIMEQPESVLDTIRGRTWFEPPAVVLDDIGITREQIRALRRVVLIGMGTSLHAAMIGRLYMERIAGIPSEFDNASEFRYRAPLVDSETLIVAVAQSGETVDTLAGMEEAKRRGSPLIAICNMVGSQATRVADGVVYTRCGLEIGVASTKTLLGAITALYLLACYLGQERGAIDAAAMSERLNDLARMPQLVGEALKLDEQCEQLAHEFATSRDFLFLGRGGNYPVALEGALKLKEISYIHAEGYPAGEMKHGPIALIDQEMPVVVIAPRDAVYEKTLANIEEVRARDGRVIAIGTQGDTTLTARADHVILVPAAPELLQPLVTLIPLQFLAYHIAVRRGCDVDQPRNLAKTVTVE